MEDFMSDDDGGSVSSSSSSSDSSSDDNSIFNNNLEGEQNRRLIEIFQKGIMEVKNPCVLMTVKKTIRKRIFQMIKFVDDDILRTIKLRQKNNLIHLKLQDLNRLDDDDVKRAKFWLTYQKEIKNVLTTRKTEVSNQMKDAVVKGKMIIVLI